MIDIDELECYSKAKILIFVARELVATRKIIEELKSEVDTFLRPRIVFLVKEQVIRRLKMKDTEKVTAALEIDDAKGFPTGQGFDQAPVWSIDDNTIATLAPSDDGLTCDVIAQKPGNAVLSVAGVAAGVSYVGTVPAVVTAGDAASIKISLGEPVAQ